MREAVQRKHYSPRTAESYAGWIKRFILFHGKRHPDEMGGVEVEAFLTHLAVHEHVAASTQSQALSALLVLYREVLRKKSRLSCGQAPPSRRLRLTRLGNCGNMRPLKDREQEE